MRWADQLDIIAVAVVAALVVGVVGLVASWLLRTRSLRALDGIPNAQGTELLIPVARRDRMNARELAVNVELALAEARLAALESPSVPPSLPPR